MSTESRLGLYAFSNFGEPNAQRYYRIEVPATTLLDMGLAHIYLDAGRRNRDMAARAMISSDIALAWHLTGATALTTAEDFAERQPIKADGQLLIPPAFVLDMDDAIELVAPLNESYVVHGVLDWEGKPLSPGDSIAFDGPDGREITLWKDKETMGQNDETFDIARNIENLQLHYTTARKAAGVTVTTPALADIYRQNGVEHVYVYPNSIRPQDHFFPNLAPHKGIRILWEGGASHFDAWNSIARPVIDVVRNHPNVTLVVYGAKNKWMDQALPPEQFEWHPWTSYSAYKITRAVLDCDINLCPLLDTAFNACKSGIRWYEASLGPNPEATLAANAGPYKEIEDGKTGMLYNNPREFVEKLEALIKNAELRKTLGSRAQTWVLSNRAAEKTVVGLLEFYEEIKARQRREALAS